MHLKNIYINFVLGYKLTRILIKIHNLLIKISLNTVFIVQNKSIV